MLCVASLPRLFVGALAAGVRFGAGVEAGADRVGAVRSGVDAIGVGWLIGAAHALTIKIATINKINRRIFIAPSPERYN
jgi:hypothetical protein